MKPAVSVILPTRNGAAYIHEAISSVLCQKWVKFELLVVDDASTDDTARIVKSMADNRIRLIKNIRRQNLSTSINTALRQSGSEYIARIDDDDVWTSPIKLAQQVEFLRAHPTIGLVGTAARIVDQDRQVLYSLVYPTSDSLLRRRMLQRNQFFHSSVMFRRQLVRRIGGYNTGLRRSQDYELWLRIGKIADVANLPEVMVDIRQRQTAVSYQHHHEQFWSFLRTAFAYRTAYPNFYRNVPVYIRESALNQLPRSTRQRLRGLRHILTERSPFSS